MAEAKKLVVDVYHLLDSFPKFEKYALCDQIRRAIVSVPSNIAEGYGRVYEKETTKFLSNALGSASELETQIIISKNLDYIDVQEAQKLIEQIEEIIRMLTALIKSRSI